MIDKPRNPYAAEDFANAVKEASVKFSEDLKKMGEQIKENFPFMDEPYVAFDDMNEDYCGIMRLDSASRWEDAFRVLLANGYKVTAQLEDATETERQLDGADKFVVIEFERVE